MSYIDDLEQQDEYENRVMVWTTNFKDNYYVNDFESNFCASKFVGTEKEYGEKTAIYFKNHTFGKIIGINRYTLDEWNMKHPPITYPNTTIKNKLDKYFDDIFDSKKQQRIKAKERAEYS